MKKIKIANIFWILEILISFSANAQRNDWHLLDLDKDSLAGISLNKAYRGLLKGKKNFKVIVAVIDSGIDTTHEDLKSVLWIKKKDFSHGINFICRQDGKEDITNLASEKKPFYSDLLSEIPKTDRNEYKDHWKMVDEYDKHVTHVESMLDELQRSKLVLEHIIINLNHQDLTLDNFKKYNPKNEEEQRIVNSIIDELPKYSTFEKFKWFKIDKLIEQIKAELDTGLNKNLDVRVNRISVNTDVSCDDVGLLIHPDYTPAHGTHVAGIIGAVRNNKIGINGIADHVQIMVLKVISNVLEVKDKNLANAIHYAVDNGARVINISIGRLFCWDKFVVDEAVRYAQSKNVLIVHAAGNEGKNLDKGAAHFPNKKLDNNKNEAKNWIEVGASGPVNDSTIIASFSNYGKRTVDVFAPGVDIYSTMPGSNYHNLSGTSMSAPIVAGIAALIMEYYPKLTAIQIKEIIMQSVFKPVHQVLVKDDGNPVKCSMDDICVSGGIVNAFNALKLAEQY